MTLIDVRPVRHVTTEHDSDTGRSALTTRHRVRGHWKHQVHGPGRAARKLIWVPDYIRGLEGAPFQAAERVYVWRR